MVWLVDAGHWFTTRSNMADEREYYDFHNSAAWTGVGPLARAPDALALRRGRQRAARGFLRALEPRLHELNPPFSPGPMQTLATVSNAGVADASTMATHNITPAFVYGGNTSIWGTTSELYRVAVFTDEDCLNPVFRGAMVGSPAYVPREIGPLAMPVDVNGLTDARGHFLKFGSEPDSKSAEGLVVKTNEMDQAPAGDDSHTGLPASQVVNAAKVDLWDSDWEGGRYYWTVIPVDEIPAQQASTTLASGPIARRHDDRRGGRHRHQRRRRAAHRHPARDWPPSPRLPATRSRSPLRSAPPMRSAIASCGRAGAVTYMEDELTQDACASGRRLAFAKTSDPVVDD